jgi:hypothetical protein
MSGSVPLLATPIKGALPRDRSAPRSQAGNPPRDIRVEFLVLTPKALAQGRLFVEKNKEVESRPHCNTVFKNADAAEKQPLTENQRHDGNIHGISHVPIQAADNQMLRRQDRCRCTESLEREKG